MAIIQSWMIKHESLDDRDELPDQEELATDVISELEAAVEEPEHVLGWLENGARRETVVKSIS